MNVPSDIQNRVGEEFIRRYPEFYASAANARLLSSTVDQYVAAGASFSVDTLANCFHHLQAAGALQQEEPEVVELSRDEQAEQRYVTELVKNVHKMPDSALDNALQGLGVWVPKTGGRMWREE